MAKVTSERVSSIAGKYMAIDKFDHIPTDDEWAEMRSCFASCVSQDETPAGKTAMHEWDEDALSK